MAHNDALNHIEISAEHLLNKSCLIYGKTGSGKSHIIKHLLYLLRDYSPIVIVFSKSEKVNNAYSVAMVPRCFVHDEVSVEILRAILERQVRARGLYERATNIETLDALFQRIADGRARETLARMQRAYEDVCSRAGIDEALSAQFKEQLVKFYRAQIMPAREQLNGMDLNEKERITLTWINFNPHITMVFDDCSTDIQKLKTNADILESFFQGRHSLCTIIMSLHSDAMVIPCVRSNAYSSFFTDSGTAGIWISKTTNGFTKPQRDNLSRYAARILVHQPPNTKMVYVNGEAYLCEIPPHGEFSAVSSSAREFATRVSKKEPSDVEPWMSAL